MTSLNWAERFYFQTGLSEVNPVTGDGALEYLAKAPRGVLDELRNLEDIRAGQALTSFLDKTPSDNPRRHQLVSESLEEIMLYERFKQVSSIQERFQKTPRRLIGLGLTTIAGYLGYKYNSSIQLLTYDLTGSSDSYLQENDIVTNTLYSATFALSSLVAFTRPVIGPLSKWVAKKRIDRDANSIAEEFN